MFLPSSFFILLLLLLGTGDAFHQSSSAVGSSRSLLSGRRRPSTCILRRFAAPTTDDDKKDANAATATDDVKAVGVQEKQQKVGVWGRVKRFFRPGQSRMPKEDDALLSGADAAFSQLKERLSEVQVLPVNDENMIAVRNTTIADVKIRIHPLEKKDKDTTTTTSPDMFLDQLETVVEDLIRLEKFSRSKATLSDLVASYEFKGSWKILTNPAMIQDIRVDLFPLKIYNLSIAVYDGDTELVKFYGDFEANLETRHLDFSFQEMVVLQRLARLPKQKKLTTLGKKEPSEPPVVVQEERVTIHDDKKPFLESIRTNETSVFMENVLTLFDDWYSTVVKHVDKLDADDDDDD